MESRTSLTRHAHLMRDPNPQGPKAAAKLLWHSKGIATIFPGDCPDRMDRMFVEAVASRLYGKREGN